MLVMQSWMREWHIYCCRDRVNGKVCWPFLNIARDIFDFQKTDSKDHNRSFYWFRSNDHLSKRVRVQMSCSGDISQLLNRVVQWNMKCFQEMILKSDNTRHYKLKWGLSSLSFISCVEKGISPIQNNGYAVRIFHYQFFWDVRRQVRVTSFILC